MDFKIQENKDSMREKNNLDKDHKKSNSYPDLRDTVTFEVISKALREEL